MPDNDVFSRTMAKGWRKPARLANAGATAEEVAPYVIRALWQTLHESGGCPGLDRVVTVVRNLQGERTRAPLLFCDPTEVASARASGFETLRDIEVDVDRHKHTALAADVARACIVKIVHDDPASYHASDIGEEIAAGFCRAVIEHYQFDQQRPLLVGARFSDYGEARAWEQGVIDATASEVTKIAHGILRDTTGQALPRPRIKARSYPTADLLDTVIVL